ncbi:MAG: hypothetical protein B6D74_01705, partial [gamma proteobacterium symbiont of Ctena orbiculata]
KESTFDDPTIRILSSASARTAKVIQVRARRSRLNDIILASFMKSFLIDIIACNFLVFDNPNVIYNHKIDRKQYSAMM